MAEVTRETWRGFLVTPQTVLRWHRELVRRKWSRGTGGRPGRPSLAEATRALILRLASGGRPINMTLRSEH
jgi:hypothetical protein